MTDPDACFFTSTGSFFVVGEAAGALVGVGLGVGVGVGVFLGLGVAGSTLIEDSEGGANDCDACSLARRFSLIWIAE